MELSIVTIHLNQPECLLRTHASLSPALGTGGVEWILIDGGSEIFDSAEADFVRILRQSAHTVVSEVDNGIYDAMNKGTRASAGDYVLYLNAGDELHPDFSWPRLAAQIVDDEPGMVWGTCHERYSDGRLVKVKTRSPRLAWYGIPVNHQNALFRRDLLGASPYNEKLVYCADYDLMGRLLGQDCSVKRTDMPVAIFQRGGTSAKNFMKTMQEEELLRTMHFGVNPILSRMITHFKLLNSKAGQYPVLRRLMRKWV